MNYLVEAFKALEDIDDSVVNITPKPIKRNKIKESQEDYYVLSDGKNPRNSVVYTSINNLDKFIAELESSKPENYYELLHYVKGNPIKVWDSKSGRVKESCEIKESPRYDLGAEHDSRKSFYGKAKVDVRQDGSQILYSYGTPVCRIKDGKAVLLRKGYLGWDSSQTTLRHVKEFLKQNGLKADSISQMKKDYSVEQADANEELVKEEPHKITESEELPVNTKEEAEEAQKELDKLKEKEPVEKIVDAEAETIDDLKDSYLGNYVLICPTCRKYFFKKPELVERGEDSELFNVGEECPHCGAEGGFEIKYQIAKADLDTSEEEKEAETTGAPEEEKSEEEVEETEVEVSEKEEDKKIKRPKEIEVEKESLNRFENIDEKNFDKLINEYLHNVYSNVDSYTTTGGKMIDESIELVGDIKYTSGKTKSVKFVFESSLYNKDNQVRLFGFSEDLKTDKKAFALTGRVEDDCLLCESLSYSYKVKTNDKEALVRGRHKI